VNRQQRLREIVMACALAIGLQVSYADSPNGGPPSGPPPGPPPEAVSACTGKSAGDQVSFTLRDGHQVSGKWPETEFTLQT
jgi:hypothetical protein